MYNIYKYDKQNKKYYLIEVKGRRKNKTDI